MTELGLHESGMSPRTTDDRPVHFIPWVKPGFHGIFRIMTRKEAFEYVSRPADVNDWLAMMNLGTALYVVGQSDEARAVCAQAAKMHPNSSTLLNLAVILEGYGEFDKSLILAEQAVKFDQTNQFAGLLWAQGLLRQGRWDEGWGPFCWFCWGRIWAEMEQYIPEWRGEPLEGKRILVMQGGGFGDNLMFFRWIGELKKLGAHVTYACPGDAREHPEHKTSGSMVELLEGHPWVDELIPTHEGPETNWLPEFDPWIIKNNVRQYDYFVPIMALPRILKTTVETIPGKQPYLFFSDQSFNRGKVEIHDIRYRLQRLARKPRVGLCWKAGEVLDPRRHRSMTDKQALRLLAVDTVEWVSLQYGTDPPAPIPSARMTTWKETAQSVAELDLVITVDSGMCHLAGAMGKNTWVLIPGLSDWKWLLNRDDSPFYPSMLLFRNKGIGLDNAVDSAVELLRHVSQRHRI